MRISDWGSDVCSSDLLDRLVELELRDDVAVVAGLRGGLGLGERGLECRGIGSLHSLLQFRESGASRIAECILAFCLALFLSGISGRGDGHAAEGERDADREDRSEFHEYRLLRSEEHTSELQSLMRISYAVFCLKKKKTQEQSKK